MVDETQEQTQAIPQKQKSADFLKTLKSKVKNVKSADMLVFKLLNAHRITCGDKGAGQLKDMETKTCDIFTVAMPSALKAFLTAEKLQVSKYNSIRKTDVISALKSNLGDLTIVCTTEYLLFMMCTVFSAIINNVSDIETVKNALLEYVPSNLGNDNIEIRVTIFNNKKEGIVYKKRAKVGSRFNDKAVGSFIRLIINALPSISASLDEIAAMEAEEAGKGTAGVASTN